MKGYGLFDMNYRDDEDAKVRRVIKHCKQNKRKADFERGRDWRDRFCAQGNRTAPTTNPPSPLFYSPLGEGSQQEWYEPHEKAKLNEPADRAYDGHMGLAVKVTDQLTHGFLILEVRIFKDLLRSGGTYLKAASDRVSLDMAIAPFIDRYLVLTLYDEANDVFTHYTLVSIRRLYQEGRCSLATYKGNKNRININLRGYPISTPYMGDEPGSRLVGHRPSIHEVVLRLIREKHSAQI